LGRASCAAFFLGEPRAQPTLRRVPRSRRLRSTAPRFRRQRVTQRLGRPLKMALDHRQDDTAEFDPNQDAEQRCRDPSNQFDERPFPTPSFIRFCVFIRGFYPCRDPHDVSPDVLCSSYRRFLTSHDSAGFFKRSAKMRDYILDSALPLCESAAQGETECSVIWKCFFLKSLVRRRSVASLSMSPLDTFVGRTPFAVPA